MMAEGAACWEAPAKVNLVLDVHGIRADGFHEIRTVFQAIELVDLLRVEAAPRGTFELTCSDPGLPVGETNLVTRAYRLVERHDTTCGGARAHLEKHIPDRAGLGGGSSDAAAMLVALDRLYGLKRSDEDLERLGAEIGSDVSFFVRGGTQLGAGRGERLSTWPSLEVGAFWIGVPRTRLSTAEVYRRHAAMTAGVGAGEVDAGRHFERLGEAIRRGDAVAIGASVRNTLEPAALVLSPDLLHARVLLEGRSLGSALSGSGSAFFAYFETFERADAFAKESATRRVFPQGFVASPRPCGVRIRSI
jgi:4-diphosphocytidyl-2C-methyl-D-erythritol kinase